MSPSAFRRPIMVQFDCPPPAYLRLFCREFVDFVDQNLYEALQHKFLNSKQIAFLTEKVTGNNEAIVWERRKRYLFKCLLLSDEPTIREVLLQIFKEMGEQSLIDALFLKGLKPESHNYYGKFLIGGEFTMKLDRIVSVLDPIVIVDYLRNLNCRDYEDLVKRVDDYIKAKQFDDAACALIRGLPYCTDRTSSPRRIGDWYYDFLEACLSHGYTRMIPRYIDADYNTDLANYYTKKKMETQKHMNTSELNDLLVASDVKIMPFRDQKLYERFRIFDSNLEYDTQSYELYPYQKELVAYANSGKNTIICAPTGSGKTVVAMDIILNHIRKMRECSKVARTVMLVPTVPLVDQQALHFVRYTFPEYFVYGLSGAETILLNRAEFFLASDICVMTPQILINMLTSVFKRDRVYLTDITMMIFDECHHAASGDHPYRMLMEMLDECKLSNNPQIIGLTASIGVGKTSWNVDACRNQMLRLCANLNADCITTVRKQIKNLRLHVSLPVDIFEKVERPKNDQFAKVIGDAMLDIQQEMSPKLEKILADKSVLTLRRENINFPDHRQRVRYQIVVATLKQQIQKINDDLDTRAFLTRCIDHLSCYFHALNVADLLPNRYAREYLSQKMSQFFSTGSTSKLMRIYRDIEGSLISLAVTENVNDKHILQRLHTIIIEQYQTKEDSRTLIFVATRICAQNLADHLSRFLAELSELPCFYGRKHRVGYMTSSNQSASAGGQSSEMQRRMRERFERGDVRILVVTSVADEGINIMECNLIIKYNNVGSERTLIQRRGRARVKGSRSILLALDDGVESQEYENVRKEVMMKACIEDLQSRTDDQLRQMILQTKEKLERDRLMSRAQETQRRNRLKNRNVKLCESMEVRRAGQSFYVCCDPTVWQRSTFATVKNPSKDGFFTVCAHWFCTCNCQWGSVIHYLGAFLPRLDLKKFTLERLDTSEMVDARNNLKWSNIENEYFTVDQVNAVDLRAMVTAFGEMTMARQSELVEQESLANRLLLDKYARERNRKPKTERIPLEE